MFLVCVDLGNIEYSDVTHPLFVPLRKGGTLSSIEAVHITCVFPDFIKADPSAYLIILVCIDRCLNVFASLPSDLI